MTNFGDFGKNLLPKKKPLYFDPDFIRSLENYKKKRHRKSSKKTVSQKTVSK